MAALHPKRIDLSLDRVEGLLACLGNPHLALPPVVHVAGTNGKGSTLAFLRAFLEAAGCRVHAYVSPHLVRFNERIRLAGHEIADAALTALLEECERANAGRPVTFFEITTAAAFLAFARHPADVVLLETGLGGRLDATNLVPRPRLTAITPVSLDHQHFLGRTLAAIAGEKAGILKPDVPCVLSRQPGPAARAIAARAATVHAPLLVEGDGWSSRLVEDGFVYRSALGPRRFPRPALLGRHQVRNATQAIACAENLAEFQVSDEAVRSGLAGVRWPARLQRLTRGPLVDVLPPGWELWLDGAHNPAGARALAEVLGGWRDRPLFGVFGMLSTKEPAGFFRALAPCFAEARTVGIPGEPAALPAEILAAVARRAGLAAMPAPALAAALRSLVASHEGPARILIGGSLYLAGRVLAENG